MPRIFLFPIAAPLTLVLLSHPAVAQQEGNRGVAPVSVKSTKLKISPNKHDPSTSILLFWGPMGTQLY